MNAIYSAEVSIGTPPQTFDLALDTFSNQILVPSTDCDYFCANPSNRYNSSQSETFAANGSHHSVKWAGVEYSGRLSRDTIHLGNTSANATLFEEWTEATLVSIGGWEAGYDGVLGLAPPWKAQEQGLPSILSVLQSQALLPSSVFSLRYPQNASDLGEVRLGDDGLTPALREKMNMLPVIDPTNEYGAWKGDWAVPANSMSFATPKPLHLVLPEGGYALLDLASPYIMLPDEMANNITAAIGAERGPLWFHNIPCARRAFLPDFTVQLHGHNYSVSPWEYTIEIDFPQQGLVCATTFFGSGEFAMPLGEGGILLGNPFMRAFHAIFDFGKREVGRKAPPGSGPRVRSELTR